MVAIADTADRVILSKREYEKYLPSDLKYVSFNEFDSELSKDKRLKDAWSIVVAEPSLRDSLPDRLQRLLRVTELLASPPAFLYRGEFHTDFLDFVRKHHDSFAEVKRLEFQNDSLDWKLDIPAFSEYDHNASAYFDQVSEALDGALIFSAVANDQLLDNWKFIAGQSQHQADHANQFRQILCNWPSAEIDSLFDIVPREMDPSSALVCQRSVVFPRINDLPVHSLIVQRKQVGPPFEPALWYMFALDRKGHSHQLRNQDQAVLSEYTNKLLEYHHGLNDQVTHLLSNQGFLESYDGIANVFRNSEFLGLRVAPEWIECVSRLRAIIPASKITVPKEPAVGALSCEVITHDSDRIVFWAEVADGLRVKTELPAAKFPNPTATFLWNTATNAIHPQVAQEAQIERKREIDAKHAEMDALDEQLGTGWE